MAPNEPIAIVGSGCRFAGDIDSPSKLWALLQEPIDIQKEIPSDRFNVNGFYHSNGAFHGHSNVRHAYLMNCDPSHFDADFFGIKPSEAKSMDPQQRILMEVVYEAIEAAGMTISGLADSDTAVYAGLMTNDYGMMLTRDLAHVPTYHATGISSAIVSNRISHFFGWHGPSMTIDTGCSASLVATHLAVQSLRNGESRMALACGANLILGPEYFVIESKLNMLSPDGRSKMWDQAANGYARGDGVAAVVLKTLSAAIADGDHIECIIRETGLNQDGSTPGITMPSAFAQEALIRSTYAKAGLNLPRDRPQFFEAHGTGTPAGDPIEAEAIRNSFFGHDVEAPKDDKLLVGSVKNVLGHTEGSAGIAAVLKASLALQNSTIPPNLHFNNLSDRVAPFYDHLEIPTVARSWPSVHNDQVQRASVNSFGFGGANAHAILESYRPPYTNGHSYRSTPLITPFVFSASSEKALRAILVSHDAYLSTEPKIDLRDLAWTLHERRQLRTYRIAFAASSAKSLLPQIRSVLSQDGPGIGTKAFAAPKSGSKHRVLGIFTGQGAQYPRMAAELIETSPRARSTIEKLETMLAELPPKDRPSWSLLAELTAAAEVSRIHEARLSQPLCTALQILLVDLLRLAKIEFDAVIGHSSGEIAAAYAAGFLTAREAIYVAYYRGLHLNAARSPRGEHVRGAMLAVGGSMEELTKVCDQGTFKGRISVAASNSSSSVTISGDEDAIIELQVLLDSQKRFNRRLKVDKAYHSAHMVSCGQPYAASLEACVRERQTQDQSSSIRWFSSVHDRLVEPATGVSPVYWVENMMQPVLFSQALYRAWAEESFDIALEVGAHPALKGPAVQVISEASVLHKSIPYFGVLNRGTHDREAFATALGQLWSRLGPSQISLDAFENAVAGSMTVQNNVVKGLPLYPWDHNVSHWHEARASRNFRLRKAAVHPLLGDATPDSTSHHMSWRNLLRIKELNWLSGHAIQGQVVFPAAGYICSALEAAQLLAAGREVRLIELTDFVIHQATVLPDDDAGVEVLIELVDILSSSPGILEAKFSYSAAIGAKVETLSLAASATVMIRFGSAAPSVLPTSSTSLKLTPAINVDTVDFYAALAELGYDFGDRFASLTQLRRRHKHSIAHLEVDAATCQAESLLLHPAEMDAAFQVILLAAGYPYDGQLRMLQLPTEISCIRVNPALLKDRPTSGIELLPLEGVIVPREDNEIGITGNVNFYASVPNHASIQVQGARLIPLGGGAAVIDDTHLFSTTCWIRNSLDGTDFEPLSQRKHDAMVIMERVSAFYLQDFDRQVPADHICYSEHITHLYLNHARRTRLLVENGKHILATKAWATDSHDSIRDVSSGFEDLVDVRMAHLVGESMPRVFRGETTMIDEFRKSGLLGEYYVNGIAIQASAAWIAGILKQLADRFPHLDILELGAGAGEDVTMRFPRAIEKQCSSYVYANASGSVQPDGTALFSQPSDPLPVKIFNISEDPISQGYVEGSYGVIVAF